MKSVTVDLLSNAICPNCWTQFSVDKVKWISVHEELYGDLRLGADAGRRFRPTRFDSRGNAIDIRGMSCQELACPACHLKIPRSVLIYKPFFLSIAGTPACGKSFYLASLTWRLRQTLPGKFNVLMSDSDGDCNRILNDYEEQLFFNTGDHNLVKLAKTDVVGDWYSQVRYDDQTVSYPKPFYFDLRPDQKHRGYENSRKISRLLCLYDNAGEFFAPGADSAINPVTRHLGVAESWLFCFDPTQDPRIRKAVKGKTNDYQMIESPVTARQESVLNEMLNRIRRHSGLGPKDQVTKPLIIVCTKFDAWSCLLKKLPQPWVYNQKYQCHELNMDVVTSLSDRLRKLLLKYCPEIVTTAMSLSSRVFFIPVSATGVSPQLTEDGNDYMINTDEINPLWCEVPVLLAMGYRAPKLIQAVSSDS